MDHEQLIARRLGTPCGPPGARGSWDSGKRASWLPGADCRLPSFPVSRRGSRDPTAARNMALRWLESSRAPCPPRATPRHRRRPLRHACSSGISIVLGRPGVPSATRGKYLRGCPNYHAQNQPFSASLPATLQLAPRPHCRTSAHHVIH